MGFVLAKGVLFSLICIFFVLPALILMFDKWIVKTKKKSPKINLEKLGKFSNKMRFISVPVFIAIFIASFMLKGNLGINYTDSQSDEISKVFTENNQIAIIYKNEDEEKISQCLNKLENEEKIDEVLAYGNTINEKLTYDKLNNKLNDLGSDVSVEDYLLKILYYDYYNPDTKNKMTFNDFINFIENDAYNNEKASKKIDIKTRKDITRLKNFVTVNAMSKKKTSTEIANILEINKSDIDDIFTYYFSKENNTKITLNEFINFMNKDVLTNKKYSSKISSKEKANLKTLSGFANKQTVQKKITSSEMAKLFGIENNSMNELYKYYILVNEIDTKMTISEFSNFVLNDVLTDTNYASNFDEETVKNIKLLATFSNLSIINKQMNSKELSNLFGVNEVVIAPILSLKYSNNTSENEGNGEKPETYTATPNEFVDIILGNETMKSLVGKDTVQQLQLLSTIMESEKQNKAFTYQELSKILGMNSNSIKNIYTLYISNKNITKLTPQEFVNFVLDHKDDIALANSISNETIANLKLINSVMNGVIANKKYNAGELSSLLNMNKENTNLLYGLYNIKYENKNPSISLKEFINFLLNDVAKNNEYSSSFDDEKLLKLNTVNSIMKSAINKTKYTSDEIFALIRKLSDNVEKNTIDMLYTYYGSNKQYNNKWQMTVEEFVNFLNDNILQDERFTDFIDNNMRTEILDAKSDLKDAKELLIGNEYSRVVLNTKFASETSETFEFIKNTKDMLGKELENVYIIGDSPMAYEISQTFNNELNSITIITMISIFVVVLVTFKSAIIPLILVLIIQTAVYLTMGILSIVGEKVYFIAILIVQSILMGATIDYAILYTSYYLEHRKSQGIKEAIINSYNKSINTILTSSSILIIVTLIIANFASAIAAKICKTISEGTLCSTILILTLLPAVLACLDKFIVKNRKN